MAPAVAKALQFALKQLPETKETTSGRSVLAQMVKGLVPVVDLETASPTSTSKSADAAREKLAQRVRRLELQGRLKGLVPQDLN